MAKVANDNLNIIDSNELLDEKQKSREYRKNKRASQVMSTGSQAMKFSSKYRGSNYHKGLGRAATTAKAFEEGRGVKGAAKDVAISEVKRKIIVGAIKKLGLANANLAYSTVKQAKAFAGSLRAQIDSGRMIDIYLFMLLVAACKDLFDVVTVQILSSVDWVLDLFMGALLFFFLWGKGRWKIKIAIFIATSLEVIPGAGFFPTNVLCVLYAYHQDTKRWEEINEIADKVEKSAT